MLFNNFQVRTVSRFVYGALAAHGVSYKTFFLVKPDVRSRNIRTAAVYYLRSTTKSRAEKI